MTGARLTRRRALLLGAAAGFGTVVRFPAAGWAAAPARPRSFGMDVPGAAFAGGRLTGVLRAPRRFALLGVRGPGVAGAGLEVRVRRARGRWSAWTPFGAGTDHAPDHGRRLGASDPVWAGAADELQLRARRPVGGLSVHFVSVPAPSRRAALAARAELPARAAQAGAPPVIIAREQWGAAAVPPRGKPSFGDVQMAFVHHTVNANDYAPAESASIVLAIAKYHRDANGWNDIGYNFLVDQYGQIFEGRAGGIAEAVIGAQAQGWNAHSTGVATIGTFDAITASEPAMNALARVIAWKLALHAVPVLGTVDLVSGGGASNRYPAGRSVAMRRISGHRDGCKTSCPGTALYGQLDDLRTRAAALPHPAAAAARLSLAASERAVAYGKDAVLTGRLAAPGGAPLDGVAVRVQKRGRSGFTTVAHATTNADGSWSARVAWRRPGALRAIALAPGGQVRSGAVTVAVAPLVRLGTPRRRVSAGRRASLHGNVRPASGVVVVVERQVRGGRWQRSGTVRAAVRDRAFTAAPVLRRPGLYRFTAHAGDGAAAASSAQVYVRAVRRARSRTGGASAGA